MADALQNYILEDSQIDEIAGGNSANRQYNWPAFGSNLMNNGAAEVQALAPLVQAISCQDWARLKDLAFHTSHPLVQRALDASWC